LIPTYPDLPMEDVYPRVGHTTTRELYLRDLGPSRVAYIPWDIDRSLWDVMCVDHLRLLRNTIEWTTNEPVPALVEGPGLIDVAVWRQRDSMTVHLVNLTNPMMMRGPIRAAVPLGEQRVRIDLKGVRPTGVHLLVSGQVPHEEESDGFLTVIVPSILEHEVVAIDL
jgi:hypothetical protein